MEVNNAVSLAKVIITDPISNQACQNGVGSIYFYYAIL